MGGGGVMRAVAKVAGIGLFNGGRRGVVPDHPVSAAARGITRPVVGVASSSAPDNVKAASVAIDEPAMQNPCWEIDDWKLAGGEEDLFVSSRVSTPRLVFGGPPSLEEAKEATCELKDALEMAYLSASNTPSGLPGLSESVVLETKACVTSETVVAPTTPKYAIQAFRLLKESPAIQSVVASMVSDPNIWNAVMRNQAFENYIQSQEIRTPCSTVDQNGMGSTAEDDILPSDSAESVPRESNSRKRFMGFWQELKLRVVDMMNSLSDYFQTVLGDYYKEPADANGNTFSGFVDKALGPSLMGLAVMVIMLVVFKRVR